MRILLAVDQSKDSKVAINLLKKMKFPAGSNLILLHVATVDDEAMVVRTDKRSRNTSGQLKKPTRPIHEELGRIERLLKSETLQVEPMVVNGIPGKEILNVIRKKNINLAVVGSRGLSRVSGLLLGSVSEWVLNDATCSVLIGRPTARKAKPSPTLKLLLATDGSPDAWRAVDVLKSFEFSSGSSLTLLHVMKKQVFETELFVESTRKSRAEFVKKVKDLFGNRGTDGVRLLKDTGDALAATGLNIDECLVFGHQASSIIKVARQKKVDLVIVGSRGRTGLRRMFLGSVSHHISQLAPCSVLVVRSTKT